MKYLDESPERGTWKDERGRYRPCDEPGPYGTRCTLDPAHSWAHYDGSDDSSWTSRWRDDAPSDED